MNNLLPNQCTICLDIVQFSLMDRKYVEHFRICWNCDKKNWDEGKLSLKEFEARETKALSLCQK